MVSVLPFRINRPFTLSVIRNFETSGNSSLVVSQGPSGLNVSQLFPLLHRPPRSSWCGDIVRNAVPGDAGSCVAGRIEVPGFASDDEAKFNLPIGLVAIAWDEDVVKRAYDSVGRLKKQHWFCRHGHPGFLGVIREIQSYTHDFAWSGNRRAPTVAFTHLRKTCFIRFQKC